MPSDKQVPAAVFDIPIDEVGTVLKKLNVDEEKRLIEKVKQHIDRSILSKISPGDWIFCIGIPVGILAYCVYVSNALATVASALLLFFGATTAVAGVALRDTKMRHDLCLHQRNTAMEMFDGLAAIKAEQIKMAVETLLKRGDISLYVADSNDDKVTKH